MEAVAQKHHNFVQFVKETLKKINKPVSTEADQFLGKPVLDFLAPLKMLVASCCGTIETVEGQSQKNR